MSVKFELNLADLIPLFISLWALTIAYKNRRNAMRENLFNRQINALMDILKHMDILDMSIKDWIEPEKNDDTRASIKEAQEAYEKLEDVIEKYVLIIPDELDDEINRYMEYVEKILTKKRNEKSYDNLIDIYMDVEESFREYIGLEKLSRENRRLTK